MLCPECGNANREDAAFCLTCRATFPAGGTPPADPQAEWQTPYFDRGPAPQTARAMYMYAAFWPRAGAWVLDFLFSSLIAAIPGVIVAIVIGVAVANSQEDLPFFDEEGRDQQSEDLGLAVIGGFMLGYAPLYVAYHTIANAKGGGWGKRIVGLKVLKEATGQLPGYGTGFLRVIAPRIVGLVPFGEFLDYLWCIWDGQKQTLHDKISGTVVVVAK